MHDSPDTRLSLLLRLQGAQDEFAWAEFCNSYHAILSRVARSIGLKEQDIPDAVQEILIAVHRSIEGYVPHPHPFSFRGWLAKIAKNTAMNYLTRRLQRQASGGDSAFERMQQIPDMRQEFDQRWKLEHQRHMLEVAAVNVASRVNGHTFAAFWRTSVLGESVESVARDLKLSVGAVYVARGRVMAHLQREVKQLEASESDSEHASQERKG